MPVVSARNFSGIDVRTDPGGLYSISPGKTIQASNVYAQGGDYYSRPGVNAILTAAHTGQACYTGFPYVKSDGSEWLIYAVGVPGNTTGGTIWQVTKAGGTPTEILDATNGNAHFSINASAFRAVQGGSYAYFCWGGANVYRTNLATSTAAAVTALNPPTSAPVAALTSQPLLSLASLSNWSQDSWSGAITNCLPGFNLETGNYFYQGGLNVVQKALNAIGNSGGYTSGYYNQDGSITSGVQTNSVMLSTGANPAVEPINTEGLPSSYGSINGITTSSWMQFDNAGEGFIFQNGAVINGGQSIYYQSPTLEAPDAYRSCSQFYVGFNYYTTDTSSKQGFAVTLTAYSDVYCTVQLGAPCTKTFIPQNGGQTPGQFCDFILDFSDLTAPIAGVKLFIGGAATNYPTGHGWVYAANPVWAPVPNGFTIAQGANSSMALSHLEPSSGYFGALNGTRITYDSGPGNILNWSSCPVVALNIGTSSTGGALTISDLVTAGMAMQFVFRQDGATVDYDSSPLTFDTSFTYVGTDVSNAIPASILSAFRYFSIEFTADLTTTVSTSAMFTINSIVSSGNLPIGFTDVTYAFEEVYSVGDFTLSDPIETFYSPTSNALTATIDQATGLITIPQFINPLADYVRVGRRGGTYDDGQFRVIGTLPKAYDVLAPIDLTDFSIPAGQPMQMHSATRPAVTTDVGQTVMINAPVPTGFTAGLYQIVGISGTAWVLNSSAGTAGSSGASGNFAGDNLACDLENPFVTWKHSTRAVTDNTPDSYLNQALTLQLSRDLIPAGVTCMAYWDNRIAFGSDETLSLSWSLIADAQNGIYISDTNDSSTDPNCIIKGFADDIRPGDNDPIRSLVALDTQLVAFKSKSCGLMQGYDPSNFVLQSYLVDAGNGCIAPRGTVAYNNQILFLGPDSVYQFNGDTVDRRSIEIGPQLHPSGNAGEATVSAAAAALSAMFVYQGRLHLLAPVAGGSNNSVDWVFDFIENAWTQWIYPVGMTSGCSLVASSDGDCVYMGGLDGQIYTYSPGTGDYTSIGGAVIPIVASVTSRGMGEEVASYSPSMEVGLAALLDTVATEYYTEVRIPSSGCTVTTFAFADDDNAAGDPTYQSNTYAAAGGKHKFRWSLAPGLSGTQLFAGISASITSGQFAVRFLALDISKTAPEY
jgi:hypothetical protein